MTGSNLALLHTWHQAVEPLLTIHQVAAAFLRVPGRGGWCGDLAKEILCHSLRPTLESMELSSSVWPRCLAPLITGACDGWTLALRLDGAMNRRLPRRKSHPTHPVHSSQQTHTTDTTNTTTTTTTINQPPPSPPPDDPTVSTGHACVHIVGGGTGCAAGSTSLMFSQIGGAARDPMGIASRVYERRALPLRVQWQQQWYAPRSHPTCIAY